MSPCWDCVLNAMLVEVAEETGLSIIRVRVDRKKEVKDK